MTQRPRLFARPTARPTANRITFRSLMLVRWLLLGSLPLGAGCGWLSLVGQLDGGTGSGGEGFDGSAVFDGPAGTGGTAGTVNTPVPGPHARITSSSKLDLLFMIDDSVSMQPLQAKLRARLPEFMNVLAQIPGGMPSLHIAAVSSSLGAVKYGNVNGCEPGTIGNLNGAFQHSPSCTGLAANQNFITSEGGVNNFTGNISDVFACLANIGSNGCGFEHPFEATRLALQRAALPLPQDPDNGGFLRPDAFLGIIMLTNEDDCSVDGDSKLFDPGQQSVNDPLGGLQSYRCNEFGHRCNLIAPPHFAPGNPLTLTNCTSAEDGGLVSVAGVVEFLKSLKSDPSRIFVAALAGPPTPYTVESAAFQLGNGNMETQPRMVHSCTQQTSGLPEYADPAVRVAQLVRAFGSNGVFESICADDFGPMMIRVADSMVGNPR